MAGRTKECVTGPLPLVHLKEIQAFTNSTSGGGCQRIALSSRDLHVLEFFSERSGDKLEGGVTASTEMVEATFRFAGISDILGTAIGTGHR